MLSGKLAEPWPATRLKAVSFLSIELRTRKFEKNGQTNYVTSSCYRISTFGKSWHAMRENNAGQDLADLVLEDFPSRIDYEKLVRL